MGALYWSVASLPSPEDMEALQSRLACAFPAEGNQEYLKALAGERTPPRVAAARLGALALLPDLMAYAGISSSAVVLRRDPQGRPYGDLLSDNGVAFDFNLSHSNSYALCALLTGGGRVGVDIEDTIPIHRALPLMRRYCTEGEMGRMEALSEEEQALAFTRIWTIREALGKQEGIGMPLRYDASVIPREIRVVSGQIGGSRACLTLCYPRDALAEAPTQVFCDASVTWERDV